MPDFSPLPTVAELSAATPELMALSALLPDGLLVIDDKGLVRFANPSALRITGRTAAELIDRDYREALPLYDSQRRSWWEVTDPFNTISSVTGHGEHLLWTASGTEVLITARYVRMSPRGPVERVVLSLRSAFTRKRVEKEHAVLLSTVAHELRSPLSSVRGFSSTLLRQWDKFTDGQKQFMVNAIAADADRLARMLADLLDLSRLDAGQLSLRRSAVSLGLIVEDKVRALAASDGPDEVLDIDFRIDDHLPPVFADPDRTTQVLGNLVENAFRHGRGPVLVRVRAHDENLLEVSIADHGPGVPPDHREAIFSRFWHGNHPNSTGLGLSIVRGVVEAQDGTVWVDDAPSGGARFTFTVPTYRTQTDPPRYAGQS